MTFDKKKLARIKKAFADEPELLAEYLAKKVNKDPERDIREAELVFAHLQNPLSSLEVTCKACGLKFRTNYKYCKHCSPNCLRESLAKMGMNWDANKSQEERWGGQIPSVIAPATLEKLREWAQVLLSSPIHPQPEQVASTVKIQDNTQPDLLLEWEKLVHSPAK